MKAQRIDPLNCGCTDCLTGYSVPLTVATDKDLKRLAKGKVINATGYDVLKSVSYDLVWPGGSDYKPFEAPIYTVPAKTLNFN